MIEMVIYRDNMEHINAFKLSGHANSGPHGHDLVCAAVSAISFGTINSIITMCDTEPKIEQGEAGGHLKMTLSAHMDEESYQIAQTLLQGMLITFQTIERDYGQFISISEK